MAEQAEPPVNCLNHVVLFGRILALGEVGALDVAGPGPTMRDYRDRAPATRKVA